MGFLEQVYQGMYSRLESLKEKKESDFIVKNLLLGKSAAGDPESSEDKGIIREGLPYTMVLVYVENEEGAEPFGMQEYTICSVRWSAIFTRLFLKAMVFAAAWSWAFGGFFSLSPGKRKS